MTDEEALNQMLQAGALKGGKFNDQIANARRLQELAFRQQVAQPNTQALQKMGLQRETEGAQQQGLGYATAISGPREAAPLAAAQFKEGMDKQGPWQVGEGWYAGGQYVQDPFKRQTRLSQALHGQSQAQTGFGEAESQEKSREATRAHTGQQMSLAREKWGMEKQALQQALDSGKYTKVKDADGNEYLFDAKTKQLINPLAAGGGAAGAGGAPGAPGQQYPTKMSLKATEGEKNTIYNVGRIINSGQHITEMGKGAAAPGWKEAAIRATPFLGESSLGLGAANLVAGPDRQVSQQAQRDMIDALLYLSTGAAFSKGQFEGQLESYMPQWSDSPKSKKYKMDRLASVIESGKQRAGRAWTQDAESKTRALVQSLGGMYGTPEHRGALPQATAAAPAPSATGGKRVVRIQED